MAANYWASTQYQHWLYTRDSLDSARKQLSNKEDHLIHQFPLPELRLLSLFFNRELARLGKRMNVRQQALATAQVYVRRFYCKVEIRQTNPYLVLATALYLACKVEECPQHIRVIVSESRGLWTGLFGATDVAKLGECEFFIISEMNSQMIIHHPYRSLQDLQGKLDISQDDVSLAWSIINDHYLTDLPLLFPPHVISVTAIFLSLTLKPNVLGHQAVTNGTSGLSASGQAQEDDGFAGAVVTTFPPGKVEHFITWLAEGQIDIKAVIECSQEIISLYDVLDQANETACKDQIARYLRARGLDK